MRRDLAFPATLWLVFLALAAGPSARGEERSLCTVDDSREAACYAASEPEAYLRSRAVARLLVGGTLYCTGWLVGNQGHLLTAAHCIEDAEDAEDVRVELGAEGASCATACQTPGACAGTVVATSVTLIHANEDLDYSLVQLPINPTPTFGYLQLRASGAVVGRGCTFLSSPKAGAGGSPSRRPTRPTSTAFPMPSAAARRLATLRRPSRSWATTQTRSPGPRAHR